MKIKNIIITILTLAIGVAEAWAQDQTLSAGGIYYPAPEDGETTVTINGTLHIETGVPVTLYIPAGITLKIIGSAGTPGGNGLAPTSSGPQNGGTGGIGAKPAISVPNGATLIITGEGTLDVQGGDAGVGGAGGNGQAGNSGVNNYGGAGGSGGGGGGGAAAAIGGAGGNGGAGGKGGTAGENKYLVLGEGDGGPGNPGATTGLEGTAMGNVYIVGNIALITHDYTQNTSHGTNGSNGADDTGNTLYYFGGRGGNGGFSGSVPYQIGGGGYGGYGGNGGDGGNIRYQSDNPTQPDNPTQSYTANTGDNGKLYVQSDEGLNTPNLGSSTHDTEASGNYCTITYDNGMPDDIKTEFIVNNNVITHMYYGTVIANPNITIEAPIPPEGYAFDGYKIEETETKIYDKTGNFVYTGEYIYTYPDQSKIVSLFPVGEIELEPIWEPVYTVQFNANGGSVDPTSKDVVHNYPYGELPTPTQTGYTFNGWFTQGTGGNQITADSIVHITDDQTLYAHWNINNYTLTYDVNGGNALSPDHKDVTYNTAYGELPTPTRTGYTFVGWFTEATGGTAVSSSTTIGASDVTIHAHWTINDYTLTYDENGGNVLSPASKEVTYNTAYGELPTPTRTGYLFDGWYTQANGGNAVSSSTIMGADNVTIHAHWIANTYTVNLDMQAGSAGTAQVTATFDSAMPSATAPTRTGYTFGGYYTSANGGGTQYYNANMSSAHNWDIDTNPSTLYAYWTANTYQVTYDANGGVINGNSTLTQGETYDATYSLPEYTPTLNNYEFLGWFTSAIPSQGDKVTTGTTVAITEAQTLYAHWSPISVEAYSAEAQLGGNYFRTFYDSQTAHILPTGVTAYKGKIEGNYFVLTEIEAKDDDENDIIPKDVPVILRMEPNNDAGVAIPEYPYQITKKQISLTTSESELTIDNTDNELIGSDVTIASAIANSYILSFGSHGLGFYEWATHPLEAHKAYVIKAPSNPAKALIFRFENDVTGINEAIRDFKSDDSNTVIYNLNGIRLSKPQKGINIINGKKVWVK